MFLLKFSNIKLYFNSSVILSVLFLIGCGPSLRGVVVMPDGSEIGEKKVMVYTNPWTDSVKVKNDGSFKISKDVQDRNEYTLIAEDVDGNMGFVRGFKISDQPDQKIVIKMSKELQAKDAVIEGDLYINPDSGPGEKILKSSQ
ncbi:MAG: hypothetical protein HQK83_03855 [Fibrobacteria bacterium]|nr:hypothetical protein [Fibrobacteria bacterium]